MLADGYSGKLDVISCWDYPFESYLRINAWYRVGDSELSNIVQNVQLKHRVALDALITESGISGPMSICHTRGVPEQAIPSEIERNGIDLLVIGTMARTGIHGLVAGNTSEDIIGELSCSVVALKPPGFVSPISV